MPIIIEQLTGANMGPADKDYFLDANGNVTEDQEQAATLLIRQGQDVPKEMADKYGIGKVAQTEGAAPANAEGADEPDAAVEKADKPASNKAAKPKSNKGAK